MNQTEKSKDAPAAQPSFGDIPLACLRASTTNPRKIFNDDQLQELAASIKKQGVAQPILVRPIEVVNGITYFEIVAGERRFRASGLAGMSTVPAIVRELDDRQAYEIQVLENLQRVDLHPLEEAEGFEVMMTKYKVHADELAEKVGKSKAYIYASLKLCELEDKCRKAFYEGLLTKSTALLVARIPIKALQIKCLADITTGWQGPMSARNAFKHIEQNYMLNLKKAEFKLSDADLCKDAGSCTACPKRTGNQPEVFTDVSADVCTDPVCFKTKLEANVIKIKQIATANGQEVLSSTAAKKIFPHSHSSKPEGGYVDLDQPNYKDPKHRTYRQILGKSAPTATIAEHPHKPEIHHLVKLSEIQPLLKEKGSAAPSDDSKELEASKAREKAQELKAKAEREYRARLFAANHHAAHMMNLVDADLRLVAFQMFDGLPSNTIPIKTVMSLYGWTDETFAWPERRAKQVAAIGALTPAQLNQFIRDCALARELEVNTYTATPKDVPENMLSLAERIEVDAKKIRAEVDAEFKARADVKKKAVAKKAAKVAPAKTAPTANASVAAKSSPAKKTVPAKVPAKAKPVIVNNPMLHTGAALGDNAATAVAPVAAWPFPTSNRPKPASEKPAPTASAADSTAAWPFPSSNKSDNTAKDPA